MKQGDLIQVLILCGSASYDWFDAIFLSYEYEHNNMKWFKVLMATRENETVEITVNEQSIRSTR